MAPLTAKIIDFQRSAFKLLGSISKNQRASIKPDFRQQLEAGVLVSPAIPFNPKERSHEDFVREQ
jgi:hypothetical protein